MFSFLVLYILNIANFAYIKFKVTADDAKAKTKLSKKKVEALRDEYKKTLKRKEAYKRATRSTNQ